MRTAAAADLLGLQRIYRVASLGNPGDRDRLLADPRRFLVFTGEHLADGHTRVAEEIAVGHGPDAVPVAFATALPPGAAGRSGEVELEDLFTDPAWQRLGIARLLVADLAARACSQGAERIAVTGNPHALAFYLAVGFVVVGEVPTALYPAPRLHLPL